MSRTDVHTPHWVKARQPEWRRYFREQHDHSRGVCDLAEHLAAKEWTRTSCTVGLAWSDRNICCGCAMCTSQVWRRQELRRVRHETQRICRDLQKDSSSER